jgi:hypothetical protein
MLLRGGTYFPDVLGLAFVAGLVVVSGGLPFGLLLGAVLLSRSKARWLRGVAVLLSLAFVALGIYVAVGPRPSGGLSATISQVSVILVAVVGALLLVTVAIGSSSGWIASLTRWSGVMVAGSYVLGALGIVGFQALNVPVQQMGLYEGIGPSNYDKYATLLALRNQGPAVVSLVAAALGATAWRVTGRAHGVWATLVGCVGFGANFLFLFLQSGD